MEIDETINIPVQRADKRYFPLSQKHGAKGDKHTPHVAQTEARGLISDVVVREGALQIYLRSVVQVHHNLLYS